jgi:hypothetical protein
VKRAGGLPDDLRASGGVEPLVARRPDLQAPGQFLRQPLMIGAPRDPVGFRWQESSRKQVVAYRSTLLRYEFPVSPVIGSPEEPHGPLDFGRRNLDAPAPERTLGRADFRMRDIELEVAAD